MTGAGYQRVRFDRWTSAREGSMTWNWRVRFWRLQLHLTVIRHRSHLPDRWVIKPDFVYDRKAIA
jgi:hypothetical protein